MKDDSRAKACQAIYLLTRDDRALGELYKECAVITRDRLAYVLHTTQFAMDEERFDRVVNDATMNLLEYYLKKDDYVVKFFNQRLLQEVRRILYLPHGRLANDNKWEKRTVQLDETYDSIAAPTAVEAIDLTYALQDVLTEHPRGRQIVIDIYRARTYKAAILTISTYVDKRWIYDRAEKLYRVYKFTRRRTWPILKRMTQRKPSLASESMKQLSSSSRKSALSQVSERLKSLRPSSDGL